jgi:hypothetical protein
MTGFYMLSFEFCRQNPGPNGACQTTESNHSKLYICRKLSELTNIVPQKILHTCIIGLTAVNNKSISFASKPGISAAAKSNIRALQKKSFRNEQLQ